MDQSAVILILSLFTASFLGSWHCAVMCGPVACFVANQGQLKFYHVGRLITYVLLGALAGLLGNSIFEYASKTTYLVVISVVSLVVVFSGLVRLNVIKLKSKKFEVLQQRLNLILMRLFKKGASKSSFAVGLLTGFLPCSWLLMFVFSAITTHSAFTGGLVLFIFWLGGLPALLAVSSSLGGLVKKAPAFHQRIAGVVLIFAAVFSVVSFAMNLGAA